MVESCDASYWPRLAVLSIHQGHHVLLAAVSCLRSLLPPKRRCRAVRTLPRQSLNTGNAFDLISDIGLGFGPSIFNDLTEFELVLILPAYYSSRKLSQLSWRNFKAIFGNFTANYPKVCPEFRGGESNFEQKRFKTFWPPPPPVGHYVRFRIPLFWKLRQ